MLLIAAIALTGWVLVCLVVTALCMAARRLDDEIDREVSVERPLPLSFAS